MFYHYFIRPFLFLLPPEKAHYFTLNLLSIAIKVPFVKSILSSFSVKDKKLERNIMGLKFPNPVGLAAGFDKNGKYIEEIESFGFGFIEIGTVTPKAQEGNPKPRLFRLREDKALINRMGFNNGGVEDIVNELRKSEHKIIVGGNIGKNTLTPDENTIADYIQNFEALHDEVDYFVVNVSCPNVGKLTQLQDINFLTDLLQTLQKINKSKQKSKPILLKISPELNENQLDDIVNLIALTKITGVIAANTTTNRDGLNVSESQLSKIGNGGLSGAPLQKKSTEMIKYLSKKSKKTFVIIGVGGILTAQDALEKLEAGADLVQIYTGFIYQGPQLIKDINKAILLKQA